MRKCIWLSIMMLMCYALNAYSQSTSDTILPKKVLTTYNKMFPGNIIEDWLLSGDTFTINSYKDDKWLEVVILREGKWIMTAEITDYDHLPGAVKEQFNRSPYAEQEVLLVRYEERQGAKKKIRQKTWIIYTEDGHGNEVLLKYDENGRNIP